MFSDAFLCVIQYDIRNIEEFASRSIVWDMHGAYRVIYGQGSETGMGSMQTQKPLAGGRTSKMKPQSSIPNL